jgi:hypothetical protein
MVEEIRDTRRPRTPFPAADTTRVCSCDVRGQAEGRRSGDALQVALPLYADDIGDDKNIMRAFSQKVGK